MNKPDLYLMNLQSKFGRMRGQSIRVSRELKGEGMLQLYGGL